MNTPRPLFLARLTGTQEQMGAQHGRLTADDAARLMEFYRTMPERTLAGDLGTASKLAVRALTTAWQARLARSRPRELAARTRAFVDAVAETHPDHDRRIAALTLATMDTMQNCVSLAARARLGPFAKPLLARAIAAAVPACSTAIAWGRATHDGELMFARNFDFPGVGVWDAAPAFVVCAPDRGQHYGFFATRGADAPVVTLVNEAGLVLAPHTRWHRDVTWGGAMIVDLVHDIARRAETIADAIAIARERPSSSSWGLAVGSAREKTGIVIELAGRHVDVVRPSPGADFLVCANRYRTQTLQAGELAASAAWDLHSTRRERRMRSLIEGRAAPLTARDLAGFLGDRHDPDAPERSRQFGSMLAQPINVHAVVVTPSSRHAWLGVDRAPTCEGTWAELSWSWTGPAGGWELGATADSGFTAATHTDFASPHAPATVHVHEAARVYEHSHDVGAARAAIERAVAADPDDPSTRLIATWLALEAGAPDRAMIHVHAGLALESEPYRRGQLLLWGSRAARKIDPAQARRWRDALGRLSGDGCDELRARSRDHHRGRPHANLMMVDAY
jgi:hypothetical protein